jgi:hypothetical protein
MIEILYNGYYLPIMNRERTDGKRTRRDPAATEATGATPPRDDLILPKGVLMKTLALPFQSKRITVSLVTLAVLLSLAFAVFAADAQAKTVRLDGARTTLTTDPGTTTTLFGAGIIPLPIAPTAVVPTADAAKYGFPITGGKVDAKTLAGSIRHSGGLLLA